MKKWNKKIVALIASFMAVCIVVPICFSFTSSAELVEVYKTTDPELEFINIYEGGSSAAGKYAPSDECKIISHENGIYKMQSNSWALWDTSDAVSYAYIKSDFNTGEGTIMTVQFTVDDWNGTEIGLNVRKSLDATSESVAATYRAGLSYMLNRVEENTQYTYAKKSVETDFGNVPMHLRMVMDKTKGRISSFYKIGGDIDSEDDWKPLSSKTCNFIKSCKVLYTGIILSTADKNLMAVGECSNFSVRLQAPEGYVIEGDEDTDDDKTEIEPDVTLPEDFEGPQDALLYETFSDGNLFPDEKSVTIANPLWTVRKGTANVKVNESETNRALLTASADAELMMTAGDMTWTDYSVQMDVQFTEDAIETDENRIELLFRHRSAVIGGSGDYSVAIVSKVSDGEFAGQYLQLRWRGGENTFIPRNPTVLTEVCLSEQRMLTLGETHTVKVEAVDNIFKIYFNDMTTPILSYTDTNTGMGANKDPHLQGCIGLVVINSYVQIDNLVVRDIIDPMGGDYDNEIMGNYDEPIPDWLADEYKD